VLLRRVAAKIGATLHSNSVFPIILIIIVGLILYFNTFHNSFVWDDEYLIEKDIRIRSWEKLPEMFVSSLSLPSPKQGNFYRPFQVISFLFDYSFWKLNPVGYHITNLFFHILNGLLIYFLARMLLRDNLTGGTSAVVDETPVLPLTSLLAALLFLVHPVHTEAVTYISGRADPMVTSFCLVSLILFLNVTGRINPCPTYGRWATPTKWILYTGSIISFLCALLSKEAALIFPFLLMWCGYSLGERAKVNSHIKLGRPRSATTKLLKFLNTKLTFYLPFFILSALYVLFRLTVLRTISEPHPPIAPFYSRVITFFNVIVRYIGLLFFPQNLHMERRIPFLNSLFQWEAMLSIVLVGMLILAAIWLRKYSKEASFGLGWFLIALLPVSNIMPINAAMAEHWLYMPSIGFFLAVAIGGASLYGNFNIEILRLRLRMTKKVCMLLITAMLTFYSAMTIKQNMVWNDEISLYNSILKFSHSSARIHINLGVAYAKRDEYDKAIMEYKKAIELYPDFVMTYINMGYMYSKKGMNEEAVRAYKAALAIRPYAAGYIPDELRLIYSDKEVADMTSRQYSGSPLSKLELADLYNNVALIYDKQDRFSDSVRMYKKNKPGIH
ncbi:MAG: tetratricopeptide repeat protein, partial [Candidatus Omnitrophica bacterium]|nr:tetratricopeptide repeat protein [Candidatus Omnitrophota bacterium]